MTGHEHLAAEMAWLRRRTAAAVPDRHPARSPQCPPLGALARGTVTARQAQHVAGCPHCRSVQRAAGQRSRSGAPVFGALAAALIFAVFLSGWRASEPVRFMAPAVTVVEPAPRAIQADWPAPSLPGIRALTPPTTPRLPDIRPLERFEPPQRTAAPVPLAALGGPNPPALAPSPPPDVVGMLGLRAL